MFQKIDHVELNTQDPERTVAFYTGTFGFKEKLRQHVPRSSGAGTLGIVYLELNGTGVEVLKYAGLPMGPAPQGLHLAARHGARRRPAARSRSAANASGRVVFAPSSTEPVRSP